MVASIAQMARGQEDYYLDLAREDYYLDGGEPPGKWIGRGAEKLGLAGLVTLEKLKAVLSGFNPSDESKLVQNAGAENRQVGWDIAFSAPKSVSIAWAIAEQKQRMQIQACHEKAVAAAVAYLEENAVYSRIGKGGTRLEKADAVVATFLHGTSRDLDMNLHTHCLFTNVGIAKDGKSRTIQSPELFKSKMVAGALYRAVLASELHQKLGFELEAVKDWFEIKGICKAARDFFSKRSQAINAEVGKDASAKEKDAACQKTRSVKGHVARDVLYEKWREEAAKFGIDEELIDSLFSKQKSLSESLQRKIFGNKIGHSIDELSETESFFSARDLLRKALEKVQTGNVKIEYALAELEQAIQSNSKLFSLGKDDVNHYLTSEEIKAAEEKMMQSATKLAERSGRATNNWMANAIVSGSLAKSAAIRVHSFLDDYLPEKLSAIWKPIDYNKLNDEQRTALHHITVSEGSLKTISGRAGTGKTTMLAAAREIWEANGLKVVGCATSGTAAQELSQSAGINSETIRMTLLRLDKNRLRKAKHHVRQLYRAFLKKKTYAYEQMKLDSKTVLVVDEASMAGTKDLADLMKHAEKANAKVVLVGDHRQIPSVEAGSAFAKLHKATGGCELHTAVRQKTSWLRDAVNHFAEGNTKQSIIEFAKNKRLTFGRTNEEARKNLISTWSVNRTKNLADSVMLAGTNESVDALNQEAQDVRRRNGELGTTKFTFDGIQYHTGDRIAFHQNDRKMGVWNGDRGTIKWIINPLNRFSVRMTVELDRGETITFCPGKLKDKDDVSLAYASTIHKAQGMTVDKSFVLFDGNMTSQQTSYVALTRSREDTFISAETSCIDEDIVEFEKAQNQLEKQLDRDRSKKIAFEQKEELQRRERNAQRQRYQRVQEMSFR